MIKITGRYILEINYKETVLTAQEINELHDKLTTFINENYKELNPE